MMDDWAQDLGLPVEIRDDDRFLCSRAEFAAWADGRKSTAWSSSTARCAAAPGC
jgi:deoxyribodipyrimidine photolyase-like uncharacterized protein